MGPVLLGWALLSLGTTDPCTTEQASPAPPQPGLARAYLDVGLQEVQAGAPDAARIAFRRAVDLDGQLAQARSQLRALCDDDSSPTLTAALAQMRQRQWAAALDLLQTLDGHGDDTVALLVGVCSFHLGKLDAAREALGRIGTGSDLQDAAALMSGLVSLAEGDRLAAQQRWDHVRLESSDPTLRSVATQLLHDGGPDARLTVAGAVGIGYDSNVDLTPDLSLPGQPDGFISAAVSATGRPLGRAGPYLRLGGQLRKEFIATAFDVYGATAGAGWQWVFSNVQTHLEYDYDFVALGTAPYLSQHRAEAAVSWAVDAWTLGLVYDGHIETYPPAAYSAYSGTRHTLMASAGWHASGGSGFALGYKLSRDIATTTALGNLEQGPSLDGRLALARALRVLGSVGLFSRDYIGFDDSLGVRRSDLLWAGLVSVEWDVSSAFGLTASALARHWASNVPELTSTEVLVSLGLSFALEAFSR